MQTLNTGARPQPEKVDPKLRNVNWHRAVTGPRGYLCDPLDRPGPPCRSDSAPVHPPYVTCIPPLPSCSRSLLPV